MAAGAGTVGKQAGLICFGLYSKEYALGVGTVPPTRTAPAGANTMSLDTNGKPRNFINIESGAYDGDLKIYIAEKADTDDIQHWSSIGEPITTMREVFTIPINSIWSSGQKPRYVFQTYIDTDRDGDRLDNPRTYMRLYKATSSVISENTVIWDSKLTGWNIPYTFYEATDGNAAGVDYDTANEINSQIPFNVALYADTAANGFNICKFRSFEKGLNTTTEATSPMSIIEKYEITFSDELASAIGTEDAFLRPNAKIWNQLGADNQGTLVSYVAITSDLDVNWKKDNYSVYIDLPLNNYGNTTTGQGGFRKTVLGHLPSPFSTGSVIEPVDADNQEVITTYQPYQAIRSKMKNNDIRINSLRIKIVDMKTDKLATDLKGSIVNFTID